MLQWNREALARAIQEAPRPQCSGRFCSGLRLSRHALISILIARPARSSSRARPWDRDSDSVSSLFGRNSQSRMPAASSRRARFAWARHAAAPPRCASTSSGAPQRRRTRAVLGLAANPIRHGTPKTDKPRG